METDDKTAQKLDKMFDEMDEWFIRFGHIPAHAHNRVIERLSKEVKGVKPGNIEYYVDAEGRRVDLVIYFSFWSLFLMFLFGLRRRKLNKIISIVEEILAGYEIRAKLARRKAHEISSTNNPASKLPSTSEDELPSSSDLLSDSEEQADDQQEVRHESEQPDLQIDDETQDT